MLIRKLNDYQWELQGNRSILTDKKNNTTLTLDKVRLMSFMKFAVNVLDKMRIDESKKMRAKFIALKAKYQAKKQVKQTKLFAKSKIVKA
jgi:hypothetical protein